MTVYNNFLNCTGESYGKGSIYNGIWFAFPLAACAGTNTYTNFGSSLFLMDKMLFQFTRIGFCDDIHTKQRRALILYHIQSL